MAYIHNKKAPVLMKNDPVDPDSTDVVYFSYGDWLSENETITDHEAFAEGGTIVTDSAYVGNITAADGTVYGKTYAVRFSVDEGATQVVITHRKSTSLDAGVTPWREDVDHTVIVPVATL